MRAVSDKKERSDGRETREAILAEAEREFAANGFEQTSVRAICKAAGVNVALANRYFGNKENLYRTVAKRLFGDLGEPMTHLAGTVTDAKSWRAAVKTWVDDFLYMTLPDARAQRLCAGLFRHEVVQPTAFHEEFRREFGKPVYDSLVALLSMATDDESVRAHWTAFVWAQVSVYALADGRWHGAFRPKGASVAAWRESIGKFICENIYRGLRYRPGKERK